MCDRNEIAPSPHEGLVGDEYFLALAARNILDEPDGPTDDSQIVPPPSQETYRAEPPRRFRRSVGGTAITGSEPKPASQPSTGPVMEVADALTGYGRHYYLAAFNRAQAVRQR